MQIPVMSFVTMFSPCFLLLSPLKTGREEFRAAGQIPFVLSQFSKAFLLLLCLRSAVTARRSLIAFELACIYFPVCCPPLPVGSTPSILRARVR